MTRAPCAGALGVCICFAASSLTRSAAAYRPFDGTDADVAATGDFELELGPAHYYRDGTTAYLVAPDAVLNLGFAPRFEVVADFKDFIAERHSGDGSRASLRATDVLVKWLLQPGSLQGRSGPGLAFEGGVLTPELGGSEGFGAQLDTIVSQQWPWLTLHLNEQVALTRDQRLDLFSSAIIEAPHAWRVRPVTELYLERTAYGPLGRSALLGAIWPAASTLALDAGLRAAREQNRDAFEFRFGFSWDINLWQH
jgi:hypothetical protein